MLKHLAFLAVLGPLTVFADEVRLATYNVQNLFDTRHDIGKYDFRYLPKSDPDRLEYCARMERDKKPTSRSVRECRNPVDWNDKKLRMKLKHIKYVFELRGELPDILVLSEIENANVTGQLARVLGYQDFLVSQSTDQRGIDLAFLYNESKELAAIRTAQHKPRVGFGSRPIFEVEFEIGKRGSKKNVIFFANHWPSQGGKTSLPRMKAATTLKKLMEDRKTNFPNAHQIAVGDFNVIDYDEPHAFRDMLLKPSSSGLEIVDIHKKASALYAAGSARGSYFFSKEKEWHVLDRFFVSRTLLDGVGLEADLESYLIFGPRQLSSYTAGEWIPKRYDHRASTADLAGFSDHYPVFLNLTISASKKASDRSK